MSFAQSAIYKQTWTAFARQHFKVFQTCREGEDGGGYLRVGWMKSYPVWPTPPLLLDLSSLSTRHLSHPVRLSSSGWRWKSSDTQSSQKSLPYGSILLRFYFQMLRLLVFTKLDNGNKSSVPLWDLDRCCLFFLKPMTMLNVSSNHEQNKNSRNLNWEEGRRECWP